MQGYLTAKSKHRAATLQHFFKRRVVTRVFIPTQRTLVGCNGFWAHLVASTVSGT